MRWLTLFFVLILVGCSGKSDKSTTGVNINKDSITNKNDTINKSPDTTDYFSGGVSKVINGVRHTFALNKYNVAVSETVKIRYTIKNLRDTMITLGVGGLPALSFVVIHNNVVVYHYPQELADLLWFITLSRSEEKRFETGWAQNTLMGVKPGLNVPPGKYRISAYLSLCCNDQKLDTTLVVTEKKK
jgi:hypothetical protein